MSRDCQANVSNERPAPRRRIAGAILGLAVLGLAVLLPSSAFAAGEFDGVWQGLMERDFGPLCARTYELQIGVEGEVVAGRMLGPDGTVGLLGAMTPDGRLIALRGEGSLRFRLDGEVRDGVLLGTWSAIRNSVGDCSGSFVLRRRPDA